MSDAERGMTVAWLQDGVGVREVDRRLQVTHPVIHLQAILQRRPNSRLETASSTLPFWNTTDMVAAP